MKQKIYLLLTIILLVCNSSWGQTSRWNYHRLLDYGTSLQPAINSFCSNSGITPTKITVNLWDLQLLKNKFYKGNIGFGERYYYVDYSTNGHFDSDENIKTYNFERPIDNICSETTPKYHKVILVGKTKVEADRNICSGNTAENISWKLNIKLKNPLQKNKVYLMNFGRGLYYYKIEISANFKGDSDYDISDNFIGSPYEIFCDNDNDGIENSYDNCPNEKGPRSNNGCPEPDSDGDGIIDKDDQCPYQFGLAGTLGCPDSDSDGVPDIHDICPHDFFNDCLNIPLPINIKVKDIYGRIKINKTIHSSEQEKIILNKLPSGLYFIENSKGERRKVFKK